MLTDSYPSLKRLKSYFMRQKHLMIVLLACMLTASSMGVLLSYLMSRQMIAITDISTRGMVMSTVLILITVSIHHMVFLGQTFCGHRKPRGPEYTPRYV